MDRVGFCPLPLSKGGLIWYQMTEELLRRIPVCNLCRQHIGFREGLQGGGCAVRGAYAELTYIPRR